MSTEAYRSSRPLSSRQWGQLVTEVARRTAEKRLRKNFWRRNKASLRVIGAAFLLLTIVVASVAARAIVVAYRASRPRVIAPLASISYVDVAAHKGSVFRITDATSCKRLRVILNSRMGPWSSRVSFWEAFLPVEGTRALDLELSIEAAGVHRVFDVSPAELQSEGAFTSIDQSVWRELRAALDEAPDGDECGQDRPLAEVLDNRCVAEMHNDIMRSWCKEGCAEHPLWISKCEDPVVDIVLVSLGRPHSRFYYEKGTGRLLGAKEVPGPGQKTKCFGRTPGTRRCVPSNVASCRRGP